VTLHENNTQSTHKQQGSIEFPCKHIDSTSNYYIGHVQAPTSLQRKWETYTSHPFRTRNWSVFHNGVLTNFDSLKEKYIPNSINPVDTSVIPGILEFYTLCGTDEQKAIIDTLNELRGTFGLCIINHLSNSVYLARQGSILHYNECGEFSTMEAKGFTPLNEGEILILSNYKQLNKVDTFKTTSPFLFI
jgi:glucosamine 6-phosphate synthetase-like amidotransferase/phosphosugar isomerase protein